MARNSKIYINYENIENRCDEAFAGADETDLAILGAVVLLSAGNGELDVSVLEKTERFDKADIRASVKYWRGTGVLCAAPRARTECTVCDDTENKDEKGIVRTAHKDGVIIHTSVEKYTNDELAEVLSHSVGAAFVDEAQKAMGKMFNNGEVGKLVGLVDQLGFEEEAVLAILSYCVRLGKKSLSYAEKIAVGFHDEDISTAEEVHAKIDSLERRNTAIERIKQLFGFGGRALSATETKLFGSWSEDYGFDMDVIGLAYEITVDATQKPAPKYTDKILSKWRDAGLHTLGDVEAYIAREKSEMQQKQVSVDSKGKNQSKNSEIEDWFEQRLQKSFKQ